MSSNSSGLVNDMGIPRGTPGGIPILGISLALSAAFANPTAGGSAFAGIRLKEMRQPDAREPRDGKVSDRMETGAHRLLSVIDWRPGEPANGSHEAQWDSVGAPADWIGWVTAGEVFSKQTAEKVMWVSPGPPASVSLEPGSRSRSGYRNSGASPLPPWLDRGGVPTDGPWAPRFAREWLEGCPSGSCPDGSW
ncbi:MAG: hypothetical protein ABIW76_22500 [Fibrobacteria bacterium]